jgi:hypothetical protein
MPRINRIQTSHQGKRIRTSSQPTRQLVPTDQIPTDREKQKSKANISHTTDYSKKPKKPQKKLGKLLKPRKYPRDIMPLPRSRGANSVLLQKYFLKNIDHLLSKKHKSLIRRNSDRSIKRNSDTLFNKLGNFRSIQFSEIINPMENRTI